MKRLVKLIAALATGIVVSLCAGVAANAENYPAVLESLPSGTVLHGWDAEDSGNTAYDLVRMSILESVEPWMNNVVDNIKNSIINDQLGSYTVTKGLTMSKNTADNSQFAPCVNLNLWSDVAPTFLPNLGANMHVSNLVQGNAIYLSFSYADARYSLRLVDDNKKAYSPPAILGGSASGLNTKQVLYCAFLEAFAPYTSAIYAVKPQGSLGAISSISSTVTEDTHYLEYFVHPILGIVPCVHRAGSSVFFNQATSDVYFDTVVDYVRAYYAGVWFSNGDVSAPEGGLTCADITVAEAAEAHLLKMVNESSDFISGSYFNYSNRNEGSSSYFGDCKSTSGFYQWVYSSFPSFITPIKIPNSNSVAAAMHYDYPSWVYLSNTKDLHNTMVAVNAPRSLLPVHVFSLKKDGSSIEAIPETYLHTVFQIAYPAEWFETDVYGVFSMYGSEYDVPTSNLARLTVHNDGYINSWQPDSPVDRFKYMFGTLSGVSTEGVHNTSITINDDTRGEQKVLSVRENTKMTFFYNFNDGWIYRCIRKSGSDCTHLYAKFNTRNAGNTATAQSGTILDTYEKHIKGNPSDYSIILMNAVNIPGHTEGWTPSKVGQAAKEWKLVDDTVVRFNYSSSHMHTIAIANNFYEAVADMWTMETVDAIGGMTVEVEVPFYVNTGRTVNFNIKSSIYSMDLISKNQLVRYGSDGSGDAAGYYYNIHGRFSPNLEENEFEMLCVMSVDGPSVVLRPEFYTESGVLNWLQTAPASEFMASRVAQTGYTAATLHSKLVSKGVSLGGVITDDDLDRLINIEEELATSKMDAISSNVFTAIAFIGIIAIVYSVLLLVVYFIDVLNSFGEFSLMRIVTFGGFTAINTRKDLEEYGVDKDSRHKYVTRNKILVLFFIGLGTGILLLSAGDVFLMIMKLYHGIMEFFGWTKDSMF